MAFDVPLIACSVIAVVLLKHVFTRKRVRLPPGPPAYPFLGHLTLIPEVGQDMFFYKMGKIYGDVIHFNVLGRSLVILNSVQAATDLLEKRGYNYSERPYLPIFELSGVASGLVFANGQEFRVQRKMIQQYFTKEKRKDHRPIQTREAQVLVLNLLSKPENWMDSLLRFTSAIIIDICYGHQVVSDDDTYHRLAEEACLAANECGPPGATPVDLFPILRHFPTWFRGTYYATFARSKEPIIRKMHEYPMARVTDEMASGTAKPSFLTSQLDALGSDLADNRTMIESIKAAGVILHIAGAETTSSTLAFFVLAMVLYPECQKKAQQEIDAVIGPDRLPDFNDRLPYLEYLLQETLRWNHSAPSGIPHKGLEDDVYNGMFIPKGSTVIANTRSMTLDERVYKDPFKFDPERFEPALAGRGEPFPTGPFGFGRRMCPGRHLADESLWIAMATILSALSISEAIEEDGKVIVPDATPISTGPSMCFSMSSGTAQRRGHSHPHATHRERVDAVEPPKSIEAP
ncbi:LOW QUALITY PROTEIN: putative cytochrome p450 [Lyophyllum shimeji]|uniref:Cytochrome p450 n=1 Tax=Lyophyllum shimeji TaxID=47721 RepID=A0A9P3PNL0_LYOSH|nr:LOW QUALITY PROTEIN: putative cytochrome p450 [Lyophyllum shimeji]